MVIGYQGVTVNMKYFAIFWSKYIHPLIHEIPKIYISHECESKCVQQAKRIASKKHDLLRKNLSVEVKTATQ